MIALFPTFLVAIFAVLSVNRALEGWFSERVRNAVGASLSAAQAYEAQTRGGVISDTKIFAQRLNDLNQNDFFSRSIDMDSQLSPALTRLQTQFERGFKEIYIINNLGELRLRGPSSYLFDYEQPTDAQIMAADGLEPVIMTDWPSNEVRALNRLTT